MLPGLLGLEIVDQFRPLDSRLDGNLPLCPLEVHDLIEPVVSSKIASLANCWPPIARRRRPHSRPGSRRAFAQRNLKLLIERGVLISGRAVAFNCD